MFFLIFYLGINDYFTASPFPIPSPRPYLHRRRQPLLRWQIVRKVVRRGQGSGEEGIQEVSAEGSLQDANELELDAEQFMSYAVLGRDGSKVGFWSTHPHPHLHLHLR